MIKMTNFEGKLEFRRMEVARSSYQEWSRRSLLLALDDSRVPDFHLHGKIEFDVKKYQSSYRSSQSVKHFPLQSTPGTSIKLLRFALSITCGS